MLRSLDDSTRMLKAYGDRDANLAAALIWSNHMNAMAAFEKCLANAKQSEDDDDPRQKFLNGAINAAIDHYRLAGYVAGLR